MITKLLSWVAPHPLQLQHYYYLPLSCFQKASPVEEAKYIEGAESRREAEMPTGNEVSELLQPWGLHSKTFRVLFVRNLPAVLQLEKKKGEKSWQSKGH